MTASHDAASIRHRGFRDSSPTQRRMIASRTRVSLPSAVVRGSLEHGMLTCLGLLAREPDRFETAAVAWHARWCASLPGVTFAESVETLDALEALTGREPAAGARTLIMVCRRRGLNDVALVLNTWLEQGRTRV